MFISSKKSPADFIDRREDFVSYKNYKLRANCGHKKSKSGLNKVFKPLLLGAEGGI